MNQRKNNVEYKYEQWSKEEMYRNRSMCSIESILNRVLFFF